MSNFNPGLLLEHITDGLAWNKILWGAGKQPRDLEIREVNSAFLSLAGQGREELIGKRMTEAFPHFQEEIRQWLKQYGGRVVEGETVRLEQHLPQAKSWYSITAYPDGPDHLTLILREITEQKEMAIEMAAEEGRFRAFFEGSRDGFVVVNSRGKILEANHSYCSMLGYSLEELQSLESFYAITPSRWIEWEQEEIWKKRLLPHGYTGVYEKEYIRKDGKIFPVELQAHAARDGEGNGGHFWATVRDITDRKEVEMALRESEEYNRSIIEVLPDIIVKMDEEGNYLDIISSDQERMYRHSNQMLGKKVTEIMPPPIAGNILKKTQKSIAEGNLEKMEYPLKTDEGQKWFERRILPLTGKNEAISLIREITDRKEMELELQQKEEKYRAFFENTGAATCILENDGTISLVNDKFSQLAGYPREEIQGKKKWMEFVVPEDLDRMLEQHRLRRQDREKALGNYEFRFLDRNQEEKHINLYIGMIPGTTQSVASLLDITEEKKARVGVQKTKEKVEKLHEMALNLSRAQEEQEVYDLIMDSTVNILGYSFCTFGLAEGDMLVVKAATKPTNRSIPINQGIAGDTFLQGKTYCSPDLKQESTALPAEDDYRSLISTPVGQQGVFQVVSPRTGAFTQEDVKLVEIIASHVDAALKRISSEKEIRYISFHDSLSGLYNRSFFEQEMQRLNTPRQLPLSLILIDVNGLKLINDTFGHFRGDKVLKQAATVLSSSCRQEDIVARWGGDEFIILLPQTTRGQAQKLLNRINKACKGVEIDGIPLSLSLGLAIKEREGQDLGNILQEAEDNMYRHKTEVGPDAKDRVIQVLKKGLAKKSFEDEKHIETMKKIGGKMGQMLGLPQSELQRLQSLIEIHDIGIINIPGEIFTRKGQLRPEEWERMKKHPEIGHRIARAIPEFAHVANDILAHHEHWDGAGYPRGLKGIDIPLLARITAIVDALEVMQSGRPYKEAMSTREIEAEFRRCSGKQFDPELVELLLTIW